jgi:hypothetical protein
VEEEDTSSFAGLTGELAGADDRVQVENDIETNADLKYAVK